MHIASKARGFLLIILTFAVTSHLSLHAFAKTSPPVRTADEDAVLLSSLLLQRFELATRGYRGFVVQRETIPFKAIKDRLSYGVHRRRHPQKEDREAFDAFARRNASGRRTPALHLGIPTIVVSEKQINRIFIYGTWTTFYKKFPQANGFIAVSLPGYSANRTRALVYIERRSGGLAGAGELILLYKKAGKWGVKEILSGWQS